jgi:putative flavoprotein involved in K+ transport
VNDAPRTVRNEGRDGAKEGEMNGNGGAEHVETVIVGGGQAGLATGYHMNQLGRPFVILEASDRVGAGWRERWDSLRLFTPAKYDGLPGLRFPAGSVTFPTKDEMADYLEGYAAHFEFPVETGARVDGLWKEGERYVVSAGERRWEADNVVVATGAFQNPRIPSFASQLDPSIVQLHSYAYRNPGQLQEGDVLVVGVGNSGAEIAFELSRTHATWLSGKPAGQIPVRHGPAAARFVLPIVRFAGHHVLTLGNPVGRKVLRKLAKKPADPLIRVKMKDLAKAGVQQVPRTTEVQDGKPELEDGRVLDVANVVWCTGFHYNFGWIDLPIFGDRGAPMHDRGVVTTQPGIYFMGLEFQYAKSSNVLIGASRDGEYVAKHIASRVTQGERAALTVA